MALLSIAKLDAIFIERFSYFKKKLKTNFIDLEYSFSHFALASKNILATNYTNFHKLISAN